MFPAGAFWHPKHVDAGVIIAVFEFIGDEFGFVEIILIAGVIEKSL
jgi:hypothetical protein